jgi:hypothetical protein
LNGLGWVDANAGVSSPVERAGEVSLLKEGAMVTILIHGIAGTPMRQRQRRKGF